MDIRLNLSNAFLNKENLTGKQSAFGDSFYPATVTLTELAAHIASGQAFTMHSFKGNRRIGTQWVSSQVVGLDLDDCPLSAAEIAALPDIRDHAWLVYPSPSSTPEKPKTRVLFVLPSAVTEPKRWQALQLGVMAHFATLNPDKACKDLARLFYGSTQPGHIVLGKVASWEWLGGLCLPLATAGYEKTLIRKQENRKTVTSGNRAEKYAQAAFNKAINELAGAGAGERNATLFKVSAQLQSMALGNWPGIDSATVRSAIQSIYAGWENTAKSEKTMENGFKAATAKALELPEKSPEPDNPASNIISFEPLPPARQPRNRADIAGWGVGCWSVGVPDKVRSALLNYLPKGTVTSVEILNRGCIDGLLDSTCFNRQQFANAAEVSGYSLSSTTLFGYLKNLLEAGLIRVWGIDSNTVNTIPKNGINSKQAGRKTDFYALVSADEQRKVIEDHAYPRFIERFHPTDGDSIIATMYESVVDALDTTEDKNALALELAAVIDASASTQDTRKAKAGIYARRAYERFLKSLDDRQSSPLPEGWGIANESDYIAAFAHALGSGREGERISLNDWSRLLGISVNSVPTYLKRAGLGKVDQPQYEFVNIDIAENVVKVVNAKARSLKAYPRWIVVRDQYDNEITSVDYDPATAAKVAKQHRVLGCKVEVKMQAANAYQVVSESPVEVQTPAVERVTPADPVITPIEPDFEVVRPFREPRLNPAWVAGQFRLVLQQKGRWVEKWCFIDQFGEIVETKEPRALAELLINRHIASNSIHNAIESEMLAGGWRKVSA